VSASVLSSALAGYEFPNRKITINLAPADTRKEGSSFDLPIALAIIAASTGALSGERMRSYLIQGELALDGRIKGIRGALPTALLARAQHYAGIILPRENAAEASVASKGTAVLGVETLRDTVDFLEGLRQIEPYATDVDNLFQSASQYDVDFSEVRGQEQAKRARGGGGGGPQRPDGRAAGVGQDDVDCRICCEIQRFFAFYKQRCQIGAIFRGNCGQCRTSFCPESGTRDCSNGVDYSA